MKKEKWYHQRYRDWATQKGITKYASLRNYHWLFFDMIVPEKLGWKINQKLLLTILENGDLLLRPITLEVLKAFCQNPSNPFEIIDLCQYPSYPPKAYIVIPPSIVQKIKSKRSQPWALTGLNNSQLLISKPPWKKSDVRIADTKENQ